MNTRVIAFSHSQGWGKTQHLQVKRWRGWETVDTEEVPSHVLISVGALGYDDSGWQSKFIEHIKARV